MSLCIVPDSNALYGDPFFKGVTSRSILLSALHMDIKFVVADLVRDELRNIVNRQSKDVADKMLRLVNDAQKLNLGVRLEPGKWQLGYEVSQVAQKFEAEISRHQATHGSIPYANTSPGDLASRAIQRKRPFQDRDRGFRDSLLWLSLIEAAKNSTDEYVLVTADKIFWDEQGLALHPELIKELRAIGLQDRYHVSKSLANVLDEYIKPHLELADAVSVAIEAGNIPDFTESGDAVQIAISEYMYGEEIPQDWIIDTNYYGAELDVVEDVVLDEVVSAHEIQGEDTVLVTSEWNASVKLLISNSFYIEEQATVLVTFTIETLIKPNNLEVQDHEVTGTMLTGWWDSETETRIPY